MTKVLHEFGLYGLKFRVVQEEPDGNVQTTCPHLEQFHHWVCDHDGWERVAWQFEYFIAAEIASLACQLEFYRRFTRVEAGVGE